MGIDANEQNWPPMPLSMGLHGDRNVLARQCADLRDERDTALQLIEELREELARKSTELDVLRFEVTEGGVSTERVRELGEQAWAAVDRVIFSERFSSVVAAPRLSWLLLVALVVVVETQSRQQGRNEIFDCIKPRYHVHLPATCWCGRTHEERDL